MKNNINRQLKKNSQKIMARWEKRAQKELFKNRDESSLALRDSLPEYLVQMTDALSKTIERSSKRKKEDKSDSSRVGAKHGHERGKFPGYSIDELIFEFHILRETVFEVLEEDEEEVPKQARDVILNSIEQMVNDAATEFSESARNFQEHFTATVTHDLRTPVATTKMSSQVILRHLNDPKMTAKLSYQIIANMNRIDSMAQNLLDTSRIRSGKKLELSFENLDLSSFTAEVCTELNMLYENRINSTIEASAVGRWNKQSLRRVLENLVSNAVKYGTKEKEITVKLKKKRNKVIFSVHNSGKPILQKQKSRLFEKFVRGNRNTSAGSWGIGLNVVKGIVDAHKGKVWIESTKTKGTTFFVELPTQLTKASRHSIKTETESFANA